MRIAGWLGLVAAGAGDYLLEVKDTESGLPNSSVTSLAQTSDGYLWIGTYNGLARFDGVRFLQFDPNNVPALQHARIRKLFVDRAGTLWINTYDGSLTTWRNGEFKLAWRGSGSADSEVTLVSAHATNVVFALYSGEVIRPAADQAGGWQVLRPPGCGSGFLACADGQGTLWYRGRDQRLSRLLPGGTGFDVVPTNALPPGQSLNALMVDRQGRVWAGTERALARWDGERFEDLSPTNGPPVRDVTFLYADRDGGLWSVASGRVRRSVGREWVFEATAWRGTLTGILTRLGAVEDREGGVWFYHYGLGVFHVRHDGVTRRLTAADGFPGERVDCFFADREGNLWAGVDRGGLVRLRERRFQTLAVSVGGTPRAATTVCEDAHGTVWIGTFGGGLHRWQDGALRHEPLPSAAGAGFVFSVCPDERGRLWLSGGEEDLYVGEQGVFQVAPTPVHAVKALLADRAGRLWIGHKSGLYCLETNRLRGFSELGGGAAVDVRALAEDREGAVWAGTGRGGLYRVKDGLVQTLGAEDGLDDHPIWSLLADAEGAVWVGTFRAGLVRLKDGRATRLTTREGLPSDVICQLLDDGRGSLWLGTYQGLARLAKAEVEALVAGELRSIAPTVYGRSDGLPSVEFSGGYQPAAWRARDGRLLFATARGVVAVQPTDLRRNSLPPPVVIEELLVGGKLQPAEPPRSSGKGAGEPPLRTLTVEPGRRQIEIRYAGLSLSAPDKMRFRYQLEGLDTDWIEVGDRRSVQYPWLRPGEYIFRVSACNNDGLWSPDGAAIALRVRPQFHETWWFPTLLALAAIAAAAGLVRQAATRRFRQQLAVLERQRAVELDRARIAKDIHDDLGAGLTQITLLSELARRDPPAEAHTHLEHISGTARELTRAMDEIVWAVNPQNDTLDGLVTYVCKFAPEYLRVGGIPCRLDLPAELPTRLLPAEVRHHLFLAIKEALNNIVKHAHASEVWLRLALARDGFTFVIEDNGRGLPLVGTAAVPDNGGRVEGGHGLSNLENRLAAIGGRCQVRSVPGQGTRVEFFVPHDLPAAPAPPRYCS